MITMNPREHEIIKTPLTVWLGREFPSFPLFVFYNHRVGVWEIGRWVGSTVAEEFLVGPQLSDFTREKADHFRSVLYENRKFLRDVQRQFIEADRADCRRRMDEQGEFQEFAAFMAKHESHSSQFWKAWKGAA